MTDGEQPLTVEDVAQLLGISQSLVLRMAEDGELEAVPQVSGRPVFDRSKVKPRVHGFDPERLEAIGRVVVAMAHLEYQVAFFVNIWEDRSPYEIVSVTGEAKRLLAQAAGTDPHPGVAELDRDLGRLIQERHRLIHDITGVHAFVGENELAPIIISTDRHTVGTRKAIPSAHEIRSLADRAEALGRRFTDLAFELVPPRGA